jgi:opacity protein-like surface antigen
MGGLRSSVSKRRSFRPESIAGLGGAALVLIFAGASGAQAQCTTAGVGSLFNAIAAGGTSTVSSLVAATNTVNTAFLTQTSAFIGSSQSTTPDQTVGGAWARGIGGEVTEKSVGTANGVGAVGFTLGGAFVPGLTAVAATSTTCNTTTRVDYGGYQVGHDLARISIGGSGTNLYVGVTAGYLGATAKDVTSGSDTPPGLSSHDFNGTFQVPFVGVYGALVHGGFYADGQVLANFYQMQLNTQSNGIADQALNAHGIAVTGNFGYHHDFANNWFVEPSAGVTWSRVSVDPLDVSGTFILGNLFGGPPGTLQINDIDSVLGRIGVRVGTSATVGNVYLQPFATAALWHEFAGDVTSTYNGGVNVALPPPFAPFGIGSAAAATFTTSRVGTYGQFGAGVAGSLVGTGWLGYARVDVREGDNIQAVGVNLGLRYQFEPPTAATAGIFKAKAPPAPVVAAYSWTGFYAGGFVSSSLGQEDWTFAFGSVSPKVAGFLGGGEAGFNYQIGSVVFGVEGDGGFGRLFGGVACPSVGGLQFFFTCRDSVKYLASATGRVGYAWDRALFYVKAGGAWTRDNYDASCNLLNCVNPDNTASADRAGWTVGAGIEYGLLPNWSVKAEYDHYDFGTETVTLTSLVPLSVKETIDTVKVGLNYRFGWVPPALVTKY